MWSSPGLAHVREVGPEIADLVRGVTPDRGVARGAILGLVHLIKRAVVVPVHTTSAPDQGLGLAADLALRKTAILVARIKRLDVNGSLGFVLINECI